MARLVDYPERRTILGTHLATIVHARGRDVRVPQPLLHLGDIGVVFERVRRGRGSQRMRAESIDVDANHAGIPDQDLVDAVGRKLEFLVMRATGDRWAVLTS